MTVNIGDIDIKTLATAAQHAERVIHLRGDAITQIYKDHIRTSQGSHLAQEQIEGAIALFIGCSANVAEELQAGKFDLESVKIMKGVLETLVEYKGVVTSPSFLKLMTPDSLNQTSVSWADVGSVMAKLGAPAP